MRSNDLIETIISEDLTIRNRSIDSLLKNKNKEKLIEIAKDLESFRKKSNNLYHKVRACLFLFVIHKSFLKKKKSKSYYKLAFKSLREQVKLSISKCDGNFHLFNIKSLSDYPFKVPEELTTAKNKNYPIVMVASPVRIDPSHSGWSDIFFLGMDFPEGARVVNISVNLKIHGSQEPIKPPCECYCCFIKEPIIKLTSVDLKKKKKIYTIDELFNFRNDHLSLLKAGIVASGIVPPSFEGKDIPLKNILQRLLNKPGGIEIITKVNNIPKGSRLAVSTTLLSTIITCLMRFSNQIVNQGSLREKDRRVIASRAILGEWLGGSGGGWQDSGGLWPGIKLIKGKIAEKRDPEFGISKGCLLPEHTFFSKDEERKKKIVDSIVMVHGGISHDVGPTLEMVTEKYLLRKKKEFIARQKGIILFDKIVNALKKGNMKELGRLTTQDWEESIQKTIPGVNNAYTQNLISKVKEEFKKNYWGFLMLGGMSGGGMAFIVNPKLKEKFKIRIAEIMHQLKDIYQHSFPFIIDPLVYDFEINDTGTVIELLSGKDAINYNKKAYIQ